MLSTGIFYMQYHIEMIVYGTAFVKVVGGIGLAYTPIEKSSFCNIRTMLGSNLDDHLRRYMC